MTNPEYTNPNFLHFMKFNGTGGLENQAYRFMKSTVNQFNHHILVVDRPIDDKYIDFANEHCEYNYYKNIGPIKIPKIPQGLRPYLSKRWIANQNIDFAFAHNQFHRTRMIKTIIDTIPGKMIFYDHGSSWSQPDEKYELIDDIDHFVSISNASKTMLVKKLGADPEKITRIPNSLPDSVFQKIKNHPPDPSVLPPRARDGFNVVFLGRLVFQKGVYTLIRMARHLPEDIHLTLVGSGTEREGLEQMKEEYGLRNVTLVGYESAPRKYLSLANAMVVPSVYEPFGIVILEGAAAGLPVVASKVDGIVDIIDHEQDGILVKPTVPIKKFKDDYKDITTPPRVVDGDSLQLTEPKFVDPKELARDIIELKENPSLCNTLASNLQEKVRNKFSMESNIDSIAQLTDKLGPAP